MDGSGGCDRDIGKPRIATKRAGTVGDRASDTGNGLIQRQNLAAVEAG